MFDKSPKPASVFSGVLPARDYVTYSTRYGDLLLAAAAYYYERGWWPTPVIYEEERLLSPSPKYDRGRPSWDEILDSFFKYGTDALALILYRSPVLWLDIDDGDLVGEAIEKNPVLKSLPSYETRRGRHFLFRAIHPPHRVIDLRKDGFVGEVRHGRAKVIVPPSIHREGADYRWVTGLPESDDDIPLLSYCDLLGLGVGRRLEERLLREQAEAKKPKTTRVARSNVFPATVTTTGTLGSNVFPRTDQTPEWLRNTIVSTLPIGVGERRMMLPVFVRRLKSVCPDDMDLRQVKHAAKEWWKAAKARSVTRDTNGVDTISAVVALWESFDDSKRGAMSEAIVRAKQIDPSSLELTLPSQRTLELATLCLSLAIEKGGNGSFFLSCRDATAFLGLRSPKLGLGAIHGLERHHVIECVKAGRPGPKGSPASEFLFIDFEAVRQRMKLIASNNNPD